MVPLLRISSIKVKVSVRESWVSPQWTTALYRTIRRLGLSGMLPRVLKLVWEKQESSVRYSRGLIVPSERMKDVLLRCYPGLDAQRIHVFPWGAWENPVSPARLFDDEIAVASCLLKMNEYLDTGKDFYSLAEASQDHYLSILANRAAKEKAALRAVRQPWAR